MRITFCVRRPWCLFLCTSINAIRTTIPIMYLPRSAPPCPVQPYLIHDPMTDYEDEEERFITVDLHSSGSARGALEKLQTSAQVLAVIPCLYQMSLCRPMPCLLPKLTLPAPKIYASGDSIPLMLTLSCSRLPSLPQLLVKADSLDIHLIRRAKITLSLGDNLQETEVSRAELQYTDNSIEGVSSSQWVLQLGDAHRHVSWRVDGLAEVKVKSGGRFQVDFPTLTLDVILRAVLRPGRIQATTVQHDQTPSCVQARRGHQTHI